jgi:hypothetical protein
MKIEVHLREKITSKVYYCFFVRSRQRYPKRQLPMSCLSSEHIPLCFHTSDQSCSQYTPLKTVCLKPTTSKVHVSMMINNFVAANKVHYSYFNTHRHWHFFTILITCLDQKVIQVSSILFEIWFIIIDILNTAYFLYVCNKFWIRWVIKGVREKINGDKYFDTKWIFGIEWLGSLINHLKVINPEDLRGIYPRT